MSTLKTVNIQHPSSSTPSITMDSTGAMTGSFPYPNRNLIYNGAMQIHQRSTSVASITGTGFNTADRWAVQIDTCGTWTQTVENDAPTGSGFRKSLKMTVTSSAIPAAAKYAFIYQPLEGQDLQRIAKGTPSAQSITLSFWVKSNLTGTYIAQLNDNDNSGRSIQAAYTVTSSATWEKKTITFPADSTGILDNDNGLSLYLRFWLAAGTDFTSGTLSTSTWTTTLANWCVGQTNLAVTNGNYFQITGVQLETGSIATPFEFKSYGQDLRECQRYYWRIPYVTAAHIAPAARWTATQCNAWIQFPVPMRAAPIMDAYSGANAFSWYMAGNTDTVTTLTFNTATQFLANVYTDTTSRTAGWSGWLSYGSSSLSYLGFSAEL